MYLEDVLGGIVIERRKGCGFGEECEKGFPTNLPTRLPIVLLIRQTIVCTRVGICSTQHQLCSDRILADHVFIIGSEKFSITKSSSQVSCKQHEAYLLFLFCLSVCSEFTDWIA